MYDKVIKENKLEKLAKIIRNAILKTITPDQLDTTLEAFNHKKRKRCRVQEKYGENLSMQVVAKRFSSRTNGRNGGLISVYSAV